jgi:hypothetical protein
MARTIWRAVERYFLLHTGTFEQCATSVGSTVRAVNQACERFPIWRKSFEFEKEGQRYHFVAKPVWFSNPNNYSGRFSDEEVKQLRAETQKLWRARVESYEGGDQADGSISSMTTSNLSRAENHGRGTEQKVGSGRIDITAEDREGATVVIELKAGTAGTEAPS